MRKAPTKVLAEGVKRFGIARIEYEDLVKLINEETTVKMLFRKAKDATERGRTKSHGGGKQGRSKSPGGSIMDAFARGQKALGGGTHGVSKEDSTNNVGRGRSKSIERGNRGQDRRSSGSASSGENSNAQGNRAKWRREIEARSSMRTPTVLPGEVEVLALAAEVRATDKSQALTGLVETARAHQSHSTCRVQANKHLQAGQSPTCHR